MTLMQLGLFVLLGIILAAWSVLVETIVQIRFPQLRQTGERERLVRLERKVERLMRHMGLQEPPRGHVSDELKALLASGRRLQAIQRYSQDNPEMGLLDARLDVEEMLLQQEADAEQRPAI